MCAWKQEEFIWALDATQEHWFKKKKKEHWFYACCTYAKQEEFKEESVQISSSSSFLLKVYICILAYSIHLTRLDFITRTRDQGCLLFIHVNVCKEKSATVALGSAVYSEGTSLSMHS